MNGKPWTEVNTATLRRMNAVGYTDGEIATVTGHAAITVFYHRRALGLPACRRRNWYGVFRLQSKYKTAANR